MAVLKQVNEFAGVQDGGDGQALFTDSGESIVVDSLIGLYIDNVTDGSCGPITDNDGTTITATLAGGTDDDWDDDDVGEVKVVRYRSLVSKVFVPSRGMYMTIAEAVRMGVMKLVDLDPVAASAGTGTGGASDEITWTAGSRMPGAKGNDLSVEIVDPNEASAQTLTSSFDGEKLTITLGTTGADYATIKTGDGEDYEITWTAKTPGVGGNAIDVVILDPNTASCPLAINVSSAVITVILECDGAGAIASTAAEVASAINGDPSASLLVEAEATGTPATTMAASAKVDLANGAANLASDIDDVLAEVAQYSQYIKAESSETGTNVVQADSETALASGADGKLRACFTSYYDRQTRGDDVKLIG